ncbi:MAG: hypothetical protein DBY20_01675 [Coriobacteriia bacterium]|nr:MAG: hypothetical protein DBY20_01675 [Coriobacteriia bacterium]
MAHQLAESKEQVTVILKACFKAIDPTSPNRQGNDIDTQHRTGLRARREASVCDRRAWQTAYNGAPDGSNAQVEEDPCNTKSKAERFP